MRARNASPSCALRGRWLTDGGPGRRPPAQDDDLRPPEHAKRVLALQSASLTASFTVY